MTRQRQHWTKRYKRLAWRLYRIKSILSTLLIVGFVIAPAIAIALVWR